MSATNRAIPIESDSTVRLADRMAATPLLTVSANPARQPALKVTPLLRPELPRRFVRVPTHAVGVYPEHREHPRASLKLPLRLRSVNAVPEAFPISLVTRNISSTGVYFLCPKHIELGLPIELEVVLISRPMGRGNVVVASRATVRRVEPAAVPNWYGIAVSFDDVEFNRDDAVPSPFLQF